ncbi:enoyl-ACP reductase FabV [Clostridium oryzae]|uniref:Trans-2-enoyl-CoA reductase [NADH] n=1 Tax=Clostridium oryzae TaxID=1450648 RepID=A0A1V4IG30_9CLOT|nr:enoyl-ACP reductase FabV [Clostridium oryzae]OPJ58487.1 putative reductase [Clostridium oryzae]
MVINPVFRDYICTTAHPNGCSENVKNQIAYVNSKDKFNGAKKVLIIGASTGYGLSSRIAVTFGMDAATIGVVFERPASNRKIATAGWYNTAAFEKAADEAGYYAKTINGDAFSNEVKDETIEAIKKNFGKVDLVIYSIASPRRKDPNTGEVFYSKLKPVGESYTNKTVDFHNKVVSDIELEPATEDEINGTVKVMGGEDWELWIKRLKEANVLEQGAKTVAYSYIGPEITYPIYREGTIGKAKEHLEMTVSKINTLLNGINGEAYVSVNKALVTQSSLAVPVVPLYISLLYKVMRKKQIDENSIEQMYRLFSEKLYTKKIPLDEKGRIRLDDMEMREDVQKEVLDTWERIDTENLTKMTDIDAFEDEFFKLFGFNYPNIDYDVDVDTDVKIPSLME